jgi:Uma2 family endonuclease
MRTPKPRETLTFEAFLQRYDDAHAEWVNGEVLPKMPASVEHQRHEHVFTKLGGERLGRSITN